MDQRKGKGDREEEEELMRILNLSRAEVPSSTKQSISVTPHSSDETTPFSFEVSTDSSVQHNVDDSETTDLSEKTIPLECDAACDCKDDVLHRQVVSVDEDALLVDGFGSNDDQGNSVISDNSSIPNVPTKNINQVPVIGSKKADDSDGSITYKEGAYPSGDNLSSSREDSLTSQLQNTTDDDVKHCAPEDLIDSAAQHPNFQPSLETKENLDVAETVSNLAIGEPLYEGEEKILDSTLSAYEDREPIYEGEMVLTEQATIAREDAGSISSNDQVTERQCKI